MEHSFTVVRLLLVSILAELSAHHDPNNLNVFANISPECYSIFVHWFFHYPENNLYSHQFYKLFFNCLRKDDTYGLTAIIQKSKFVSKMLEAFKSVGHEEEKKQEVVTNNNFNTGQILLLLNVIRLHASTLPTTAFIRNYLLNHQGYKDFLPRLREITLANNTSKFAVPEGMDSTPFFGSAANLDKQDKLLGIGVSEEGIDIGSAFAKKLGFVDDVEFFVEENGGSGKKKKKNKKKKKKKKGSGKTTESGVSADHTEESPSKGDDDGVQAGGSDGEGEGEGDSE